MANFDTNSWYQITVADSDTLSMDGSVLYDHGRGSAFFKATDTSAPEQKWQIFPFNSTYNILRTSGSGPLGFLGVAAKPGDESTPGSTTPQMWNSSLSDNSVYWQIGPWGDGTFWLSNAANGSEWRVLHKPNGLMAMSSNLTSPQPDEEFSFTKLDKINDARFSSVILPSATSTSATTTTNTSSPTSTSHPASTSSSPSASSSSSGLSSGASAAIGASVGGVALILIAILAFFFFRRRSRLRNASKQNISYDTVPASDEYKPHYAVTSELPANAPVELPANSRTSELVGEIPSAELHGESGYGEKRGLGTGDERV